MQNCAYRSTPCGKKMAKAKASKNQVTEKGDASNAAASTMQEELTTPLVDIIENDNEFIILADMPGTDEETIEVKYNDGELSIWGESLDDDDLEDVTFRCYQFDPGNYYRNFRIGKTINSDAITADYEDGVLTVHLPKREEIQPRKIAVNKESQKS